MYNSLIGSYNIYCWCGTIHEVGRKYRIVQHVCRLYSFIPPSWKYNIFVQQQIGTEIEVFAIVLVNEIFFYVVGKFFWDSLFNDNFLVLGFSLGVWVFRGLCPKFMCIHVWMICFSIGLFLSWWFVFRI